MFLDKKIQQLMTVEEALIILDVVLEQKCLNNIQELVFRQVWVGKTYVEIAVIAGYDAEYIKIIGFQLWRLLSKVFGEKVTKKSIRAVLRRHSQPTLAVATISEFEDPEGARIKQIQD